MANDDATMVIVGAGLAGARAAQTLREDGFSGRVVQVGDEQEAPYDRPPLSKGYLQGRAERDSVFVHPGDWYAEHGVELRLGVPATGLDRQAHEIVLGDGDRIVYTTLLLATGFHPAAVAGARRRPRRHSHPAHPRRQGAHRGRGAELRVHGRHRRGVDRPTTNRAGATPDGHAGLEHVVHRRTRRLHLAVALRLTSRGHLRPPSSSGTILYDHLTAPGGWQSRGRGWVA